MKENTEDISYKFLTKEATACVNGIFIIIVFVSHLRTYMDLAPRLEWLLSSLSQLMVATFLFYSGYGVMESIRTKGMSYVKRIPLKRVLGVFAIYIPAVLLFAVMDLLLGIPFTPAQFGLSLVAWLNLGNSNWYIFVIICLYIITWISWMIADVFFKKNAETDEREKRRNIVAFVLLCLLTAGLVAVLIYTTPDYYYNTISAYIFGVFFSINKDRILKICGVDDTGKVRGVSRWIRYLVITVVMVVATYYIRYFTKANYKNTGFLIATVFFCMGVVLISYLLPFPDIIFRWFGEHLFEVSILMRIPMISLLYIPYLSKGGITYAIICFILTVLLAWIYHSVREKIAFFIRKRSKNKEKQAEVNE
ncbi:MAG: hypothetical protein K5639_07865 [Eubacterium sp.]|nr:hypothetical protein [Eubacterium sp.]